MDVPSATVLRHHELAPWEFGALHGVLVEGPQGVSVHVRYLNGFNNLDPAAGSSPSYTGQVQVAVAYALARRMK